MPTKCFNITWDAPNEPHWLNADNIAVALHAHCENTRFTVKELGKTNSENPQSIAIFIQSKLKPSGARRCNMAHTGNKTQSETNNPLAAEYFHKMLKYEDALRVIFATADDVLGKDVTLKPQLEECLSQMGKYSEALCEIIKMIQSPSTAAPDSPHAKFLQKIVVVARKAVGI